MSDANTSRSMPSWLFVSASFLSYILYPLVGLAVGYRLFDHSWEAGFMFGSLYTFLFIPVQLVFQFSDEIYMWMTIGAWLLTWAIAVLVFVRKKRKLTAQGLFIVIAMSFSFANTALGLFMVMTKHV